MAGIQQNVSLLPFNTFHLDATARYFTEVSSVEEFGEVRTMPEFASNGHLFLGGGSNILFTQDFPGLVVLNAIHGIGTVREDDDTVTLKVGSGENWHRLVMYCVERDLGGLENLSLIPGTAGAAPMQNIGAYGVEVRDVIESVEAVDIRSGKLRSFSREDCAFGYRESYFKHEGKGKYFISSITLTVTKRNHRFNTSYGAIHDTLKQMNVDNLSVKAISEAVIHIRKSKLPDPAVIGNAGSFFKNPTIPRERYENLKRTYPSIPGYAEPDDCVKVPAGWLIEQCGWKGKRLASIGVHPLQALVLVNYGGGDGRSIWQLAMKIRESVAEKFDIMLHPEVNII